MAATETERIESEMVARSEPSKRSGDMIVRRVARWWPRLGARWMALIAVVFAVTLAGSIALLRLPASHARQLALYWAITGVISILLAELALRITDVTRLASVRVKLAIPPLLTALVIAFNVVFLASQMFISVEDGRLLLVFLLFGILVALALSASIAGAMAQAIARIETGARRIAEGDYHFRVAGHTMRSASELVRLAGWFDSMAASVQDAFSHRQAAEAERRQLIAALSHDLRTPLTSIRAMIEAIDDDVATDPTTVRRYQHAIRNEVEHLSVLMDELFELSRLETRAITLERERLPLDDVISDAVEAAHEQAERVEVRLYGQADSRLPLVDLDPRQIHRVLTNLLQNAIRHTPPGGAVLIRALPTVGRDGSYRDVEVQVVDTGEGIAPGDLPHIFERTYRGEPSRVRRTDAAGIAPGGGLGLAIAREIVELHGGRIWADSPLPQELRCAMTESADERARKLRPGTALCFTLPASTVGTPSAPPINRTQVSRLSSALGTGATPYGDR